MNTINAKWGTTRIDLGILGRVGEANCTQIVWDVESILTEWPAATIKCIIQRAGDTEPYQASLAESGNTRICVLSAVELAKEGKATIELRALKDDMVSKSAFYFGRVLSSLQGEGDTPSEPIADILNQLEERVQDAQTAMEVVDEAVDKADKASAKAVEAVDAAGEAVTEAKLAIASAELATETAKTAAENAQSVADDIKAAKEAGKFDGKDGTNGVDGKDGVDGVSPVVTTSKSGDTTTITITDKDGTKTATIKDGAKGADGAQGEKGADGAPGAAGADGYSPSAKVTKSGDTATITITDKSGTTSAEVVDGSDAEVTKDNVVAALGYEPAEKEGNYELIETFSVESKMAVVRDAEPNGATYKFKALRVIATYDGIGEVIQYGYFKAGTSDFAGYVGYNWYEMDVYQSQGMWTSTMHRKATGDAEYIEEKSFGGLIPLAENPYISKFTIADANPCTISVYGIRA